MKEEITITLPVEIMEKLANILFQDMNFHNPHEIIISARTFLLELGITLAVVKRRRLRPQDLREHSLKQINS